MGGHWLKTTRLRYPGPLYMVIAKVIKLPAAAAAARTILKLIVYTSYWRWCILGNGLLKCDVLKYKLVDCEDGVSMFLQNTGDSCV